MNINEEVIKLINEATANVIVPTVAKQKAEFYKAGVRELLKQLQIQVDLLTKEQEHE